MSKKSLWPALFLMFATQAQGIDPSFPVPPDARYNDRVVIICIGEGTEEIHQSLEALQREANELRRASESVAPVIVEYRRKQEQWCKVEARCAAEHADRHEELVYGEIFKSCLGL